VTEPLSHSRRFRVRYYECDAFGHLNNTNYLRYMEEAAFDASAAAGYDKKRYAQMERIWLVHQNEVEYLSPLVYNDEVWVRTWVADFRRATSRRMYEFTTLNEAGNIQALIARGFTDWVFMNTRTRRPAAVPPEMAASFFSGGPPERSDPRTSVHAAPPPPDGAFTMRRKVDWQDLDSAGHVNNAVYLTYAEDCGFQVIASYDWPVERMLEKGWAIMLRKNQIRYQHPAYFGDEIEVTTWLSDVRRSSATRHYCIRRASDGATLAQVNSLGVLVDLLTGRPVRWPDGMLADFASNIA
jgi:acyl-CoA thioester hydrolase